MFLLCSPFYEVPVLSSLFHFFLQCPVLLFYFSTVWYFLSSCLYSLLVPSFLLAVHAAPWNLEPAHSFESKLWVIDISNRQTIWDLPNRGNSTFEPMAVKIASVGSGHVRSMFGVHIGSQCWIYRVHKGQNGQCQTWSDAFTQICASSCILHTSKTQRKSFSNFQNFPKLPLEGALECSGAWQGQRASKMNNQSVTIHENPVDLKTFSPWILCHTTSNVNIEIYISNGYRYQVLIRLDQNTTHRTTIFGSQTSDCSVYEQLTKPGGYRCSTKNLKLSLNCIHCNWMDLTFVTWCGSFGALFSLWSQL